MPTTPVAARKQRVERALRAGVVMARHRAKTKGLSFDLTLDWALAQAEASGFRCALTGIEFFAKNETGSFNNPFSPSFDRIVPALGYTQTNVRIVCFAINQMMSDWGSEVFNLVANSYRTTARKRAAPAPSASGAGR